MMTAPGARHPLMLEMVWDEYDRARPNVTST